MGPLFPQHACRVLAVSSSLPLSLSLRQQVRTSQRRLPLPCGIQVQVQVLEERFFAREPNTAAQIHPAVYQVSFPPSPSSPLPPPLFPLAVGAVGSGGGIPQA